jgi:hypothetical protein
VMWPSCQPITSSSTPLPLLTVTTLHPEECNAAS